MNRPCDEQVSRLREVVGESHSHSRNDRVFVGIVVDRDAEVMNRMSRI